MRANETPPTSVSCGTRRVLRVLALVLRSDAGLGLVETVMAMTLFLVVGTSIAGVLTSSVAAHRVSSERTQAQEAAKNQIEKIRSLNYDDVGTVGGNPPGTVAATQSISLSGAGGSLAATLKTRISFVADPVSATNYNQLANYKQATVTVERDSDAKVLAKQVTFIAPATRAPYGGINQVAIQATVIDMGNNTPVEGATVDLGTGPSAPRSDTTDSTGRVTFAALEENPTSGAQEYYDLTVTPPTGYSVLADDVSPNPAAHNSLDPGDSWTTTLRVYKPATMTINLTSGGAPYAGATTVTVASSRGTQTYSVSGGTKTITDVVPGIQYTVSAQTADGLVGDPVTQTVPASYPTDLTSTFALPMYRPPGTLRVTSVKVGAPAAGATVTLTGGPTSVSVSGTADANGVASFTNVPAGNGYTVTSTTGTLTGSQTTSVAGNTTTDVSVTIQVPTGTIRLTATQGGVPLKNADVQITGGPYTGFSISGKTDNSGIYSVDVPSGNGYTVTLSAAGPSTSGTANVATGATTQVALDLPLPTGTVQVNVQRRSGGRCYNDGGATVTLTGGPAGGSWGPKTTNSSGVYSFAAIPAGSGYDVRAVDTTGQSSGFFGAVVTASTTTYVTVSSSFRCR